MDEKELEQSLKVDVITNAIKNTFGVIMIVNNDTGKYSIVSRGIDLCYDKFHELDFLSVSISEKDAESIKERRGQIEYDVSDTDIDALIDYLVEIAETNNITYFALLLEKGHSSSQTDNCSNPIIETVIAQAIRLSLQTSVITSLTNQLNELLSEKFNNMNTNLNQGNTGEE